MSDEWIAGKNPVLETLQAGRPINKLWVAEHVRSASLGSLPHLAREHGIVIERVPKQKLDTLTKGVSHQGVVAFVAPFQYAQLEEVLTQVVDNEETPFLVLLDGIEDPHNLGSILRTAAASGAHGVVIPKRRSASVTPTVVKASAGAAMHVPVIRVTNMARAVEQLKDRGIWICATDADGGDDYRQAPFELPTAIVIGSEGKGIRRLVREKCDYAVHLPLSGKINSLNASVAAALIMYEVARRRDPVP